MYSVVSGYTVSVVYLNTCGKEVIKLIALMGFLDFEGLIHCTAGRNFIIIKVDKTARILNVKTFIYLVSR